MLIQFDVGMLPVQARRARDDEHSRTRVRRVVARQDVVRVRWRPSAREVPLTSNTVGRRTATVDGLEVVPTFFFQEGPRRTNP